MSDRRRGGDHNGRRPVLLTEPVSQEPSGDVVPETRVAITVEPGSKVRVDGWVIVNGEVVISGSV